MTRRPPFAAATTILEQRVALALRAARLIRLESERVRQQFAWLQSSMIKRIVGRSVAASPATVVPRVVPAPPTVQREPVGRVAKPRSRIPPAQGRTARRKRAGPQQKMPGRRRPLAVEDLMRSIIHFGIETLPAAARAAGLSRRTLHRRLSEAGLSFSKLRDEARLVTAMRLLDTDLKLSEIAVELGYSDPAHFTRAFKRWTSVSPLLYRRVRHGEQPSRSKTRRRSSHGAAATGRPAK